jgi:chromosome segregation ATPase
MAEANQKKLQKRVQNLERERETTEQQHEDQLRRVTVLEREEAAAVEECRAQLREMEDSLAKVNQDLKSMQAKNEDLGNDFATQSGQLEAARKREVQAHEAQAQLAKQLMDSMDQVKDDEAAIQKVKSQSAERGVQAFQLTNEIETLKSQKEADDKEIELKTVQLREATAATRQAGQREETARNELGTKIEQLEAVIAKLNAKSDRQQENQKLERATAAATVAAMEEERKQLQSTVEEWETKHSSLRAQYTEMQTTMALATKEIGGLKQQREDIQTKLAEQLKEQEIERAKVEKEEAALQRKVDQEAAELEKQQKLAARDLRLAEDADKFHENQMATSITDKIRQITALKKQVKQLQEQLQLEKQARTEHELEVERLNKDVVSEAKDIEDLKVELATLKTTVESKNEQITKAAAEKAQSEANVEDLKGQMQTQADNQQAQLDGEISRANESEAMRAQVEAKLKGVTQELLEVRRNFDDLNGQHNTTIAQIATLERRSKMQNAAAKTVSALAQSSLTEVTQAHSVDVVEIQKLKDDYTQLHGLLDKSLRDLAQAREELENHQKQLGELNQEKADVTSANEKTISELQASLATAQAFEKQEVAKLAAMGQELTRMTTQHGKEALAARAASGKVTELTASVSQKDAELNKARGRISELETVQQQVNTDVQTYLQQLQGLSEELKSEKRIRKECEAQLKETTSELMAEKGLSEVAQTELAQTKTQLSTALAVQPVLDDTKRQLEATAAELENTKTTMAAEHAQTRDSLTAELEETKKVMAAEHARTKDSVTAELEETKTTLTAELEQTKAALATAQGDIKDLQASKRMLAADLAADEKALAGDDDKIATQSSQIKALSGQITELEASLAKESAARAADAKAAAAAKKAAAEAAKAEAVKAAEAAESAKVAAKKQADATLAETKKAAEAAKVAAKKQADSQAIALQREAQKLSQEVAAARSATADAENTITSRDAELKAQAETAAAEAKSLRQSVAGAQAETKQTTADCEKKVSMAEKATSDVHAKLNASESEHAITKGLLQAETEAKKSVQQQADEIAEKLAHEVKSHNETQDMTRSQLDDAKLTIDRYAKETAADKAERDGLQDKLKDMERERMRIYGRLAETQMVLLSKNKALTESAMQAKRYRAMSTLKVSLMQSAKTRLQESAEENTEKLHEEVRQAEAEAMKIAGEAAAQLEADRAKTDAELVSHLPTSNPVAPGTAWQWTLTTATRNTNASNECVTNRRKPTKS